ncbi:MAG: DedA family protein [Oligoflexales bacterium]
MRFTIILIFTNLILGSSCFAFEMTEQEEWTAMCIRDRKKPQTVAWCRLQPRSSMPSQVTEAMTGPLLWSTNSAIQITALSPNDGAYHARIETKDPHFPKDLEVRVQTSEPSLVKTTTLESFGESDLLLRLVEFLMPYGNLTYTLQFAVLVACGFGFPMPEDIVLVSGGILASQGITDFWTTVLICMLGVFVGDGIVFFIGRSMGPRIKETRLFQAGMTPEREKKVAHWFNKYGGAVVFLGRFAPGLRMPLFLTAGTYGVSPFKFFMLDGAAAIISVPVWIWVGEFFGSNLDALRDVIQQLQVGLYSVLACTLALVAIVIWIKKRIHKSI